VTLELAMAMPELLHWAIANVVVAAMVVSLSVKLLAR
jgi:hypothetical protein